MASAFDDASTPQSLVIVAQEIYPHTHYPEPLSLYSSVAQDMLRNIPIKHPGDIIKI